MLTSEHLYLCLTYRTSHVVATACSCSCLSSTSNLPGPTCVRKRRAHCQGRHISPRNVFAGIALCGQIAAHDGIVFIQLCQLHCPCATTSGKTVCYGGSGRHRTPPSALLSALRIHRILFAWIPARFVIYSSQRASTHQPN